MAESSRPPSRPFSTDPYLAFAFRVRIAQQDAAGMHEVSGLSAETEVETFREGGENGFERQLAGPAKYPERIVLKHGLADAKALWDWHEAIRGGVIQRKKLEIVLLDTVGQDRWTWTFDAACPVKWTGPQLKADQAAVAFESIELIHRGIQKAEVKPRS